MGRKSEQTCHFAVWTCSELAAFLSPSFLCFLSLLLSDVLLLAQFLSGLSPPRFRYKNLPGCYNSTFFFSFLWKIPFRCIRILAFPPVCGSFVDLSVISLTFPLVFLDFFFLNLCRHSHSVATTSLHSWERKNAFCSPPSPSLTRTSHNILIFKKALEAMPFNQSNPSSNFHPFLLFSYIICNFDLAFWVVFFVSFLEESVAQMC